jgi:phosphatidylserine decarboxylase
VKTIKRDMAIRLEQFLQARKIHGGLVGLALAKLAVELSRLPIPSRRLRLRLFRDVYARRYPPGLDAREAEQPLEAYRSFNAVFTRGIKPEYRAIGEGAREMLSPCDGKIQEIGRVGLGRRLIVKGVEYSLDSLLPNLDTAAHEGGQFAVIFLSPVDCHRVFSPQDGRLDEVVHVPGSRLLVHPSFQRAEYPVYTLNERMIFRIESDKGSCVVVMVAGWGVGNITLPIAPQFRPKSRHLESWRPSRPSSIKRGDWIGTFELGSAVVLITSSSFAAMALVSPDAKVHYGEPLFRHA